MKTREKQRAIETRLREIDRRWLLGSSTLTAAERRVAESRSLERSRRLSNEKARPALVTALVAARDAIDQLTAGRPLSAEAAYKLGVLIQTALGAAGF